MRLSIAAREKLMELARRRAAPLPADLQLAADAAAMLRSIFAEHPKQGAFFRRSEKKWRATRKTRRAGATKGGCRELMARAIEQPGFRAIYFATTRDEAKERAWKSDTKSGLIDILEQFAQPAEHPTLTAYSLGGITIEVREVERELVFSNGSQIDLVGADKVKEYNKRRGGAKHVYWIDEAQDFSDLEALFDAVVLASMQDYRAECWLSGTPGRDCAGMFYDVTKELEDGEEPLPEWEVHTLAQVDNPFFGHVVADSSGPSGVTYYVEDNTGTRTGGYETREEADAAAVTVRWERTAGEALRAKGWKGNEPDFVREYLGRWVKQDARYVYPVHAVPKHQIIYAPQRLADNPLVGTHDRFADHPPWLDVHAAIRDLPRARRGHREHQWMYAIGADFGYHPDPFALVVWAFCTTLTDVFEMFSWKQTRVHTDDQGAYMRMLWDALPNVVSFVGDPAGKQDDFEVWRSRMNLPIEEANKRGKNTLEEFLADDIRRGRVHLRDGSPLYQEMRHLVYLPTKPGKTREVHKHRKVNGVIHGDHCCDCARYSYTDLSHYLSKIPGDKPAAGSRQAYEAEAEVIERRIDDAEERRAAALADGDEMIQEYGGGYDW